MTDTDYIADRLGGLVQVSILGQTIDIAAETDIPRGASFEDLLYDHPHRVMVWKRILAKCATIRNKASDHLEEVRNEVFRHYWDALEVAERKELADGFLDEPDPGDPFRPSTSSIAKARVAKGPVASVPRWRRNFSDDRCWGFVNYDDRVIAARKVLRVAKGEFELARGLCDALEARGRSLSHLCAIHRDGSTG